MSVAGFPSWSGNPGGGCDPAPTPWATNVARKGIIGFADLTALGLTPSEADKIVGRLVMSIAASKDGTTAYDPNSILNPDPIDPTKLKQVGKLVKIATTP